jgi:hypothetical protein
MRKSLDLRNCKTGGGGLWVWRVPSHSNRSSRHLPKKNFGKPPAWSEVSVDLGHFRYLRYRGPNGSAGNVAEIVFYRNGVKVNGAAYGTPGSWHAKGNTFERALDDDVNTFFDGPTPNNMYVGIDTGLSTPTAAATPE